MTEFTQPPLLNSPKHFHEYATVLFTLKGFAADNMTGRTFECRPSNILIRPAGEIHTHHYGRRGIRGLVLEVKSEKNRAISDLSKVLDRAGSYYDNLLSELANRLYLESLISDSASEMAIEGITLEILARIARLNSSFKNYIGKPLWLVRAEEYIQENFTQSIGLSRIAEETGVHPAHLAEIFRKYHNCTVGDHIRRLRLNYAVKEVMFSEKTLAEISANAGFYDQSHFTKHFKRQNGMTPAEMRSFSKTPNSNTKSLQISKTI